MIYDKMIDNERSSASTEEIVASCSCQTFVVGAAKTVGFYQEQLTAVGFKDISQ